MSKPTYILSYSLVLLYVVAMLRPIQPFIYYYCNESYITQHFCVNKDKPQMHCDGKCYLDKILKKQQKQTKNHPQDIRMENYPIGFVSIIELHIEDITKPVEIKTAYQNNYKFLFLHHFFRPPEA